MKRIILYIATLLLVFVSLFTGGCDFIGEIFGGDSDTVHTKSYEPITGKFYLYEANDARITSTNTYFDINGTKGNFTLKYYENGVLKKEGEFQKIVTYTDKIGYWTDNLHFNVKCGDSYP